ncbi:hypothetical protein J2X66_000367 [Pseudomonas sp. 3296]|nr:hypothetical protein [Pseudomonas sp. 3296]
MDEMTERIGPFMAHFFVQQKENTTNQTNNQFTMEASPCDLLPEIVSAAALHLLH